MSDSSVCIHVRRRCGFLIGIWNTLHVDAWFDDLLARPAIAAGYRTRDQAHAQVEQILDADPALDRRPQWRMDVQLVWFVGWSGVSHSGSGRWNTEWEIIEPILPSPQ
ncbi:hypothetical protein [Micromonospora saelicesensis]|uniref:hypothetical protein n=1 Tax=Micromonospora saelicesensis TaxID=285676 RepID=UPI0011BD6E9A|nr:hypothetical protein [Micromonospora saelicesensis]